MRTGARFFVVVVSAVLTSGLVAGSVHAQDWTLGLRGGVHSGTFEGTNVAGLEHVVGATVGVSGAWRLSQHLSLESEVNWIRKGAEGLIPGSVTGFDESLAVDLRLDYLQVPVLARLNLPQVGSIRPSLIAGPAVGWDIGCDVRTAPEQIALTLGCGSDDSARSGTDWSLLLGGGLGYSFEGGAGIGLEARYDHGLTELDDGVVLEIHNRGFSVTARVTMPLGR